MNHHYEGKDLIVRKIEVGTMENNVYILECPHTHEGFLVDGCFEPDKIMAGAASVLNDRCEEIRAGDTACANALASSA